MKNLICAVAVLAVSTTQADTIYVDADCPGAGVEPRPTTADSANDSDDLSDMEVSYVQVRAQASTPCCINGDPTSCFEAGCDWLYPSCEGQPTFQGCVPANGCFDGCGPGLSCQGVVTNPCGAGGSCCDFFFAWCIPDGTCPAVCDEDLDGDGNVFVTDLLLLLMDFGSCDGSPADFDGDGCVTIVDLLTLLGNWGPCPGSPCVWDVNGDGTVDNTDLWQVLGNLGPCDTPAACPEDVNGDGVVDFADVIEVATHFGPCP
jgi:hypothetical protein